MKLELSTRDFNMAMTRSQRTKGIQLNCVQTPNELGLYSAQYSKCINIKGKKKSIKLRAYYKTKPNTLPHQPDPNMKWYHKMLEVTPKAINTRS